MAIILAPTNFEHVLRNALESREEKVFNPREVIDWGLRIPASPQHTYSSGTVVQQISELARKGILEIVRKEFNGLRYYQFKQAVKADDENEHRFFVGEIWFHSEAEAIEHCRQHIIQKKTRKIVWE